MFVYQLWGSHDNSFTARWNDERLHPSVLRRGMVCVDPDKPRLRTDRIPKSLKLCSLPLSSVSIHRTPVATAQRELHGSKHFQTLRVQRIEAHSLPQCDVHPTASVHQQSYYIPKRNPRHKLSCRWRFFLQIGGSLCFSHAKSCPIHSFPPPKAHCICPRHGSAASPPPHPSSRATAPGSPGGRRSPELFGSANCIQYHPTMVSPVTMVSINVHHFSRQNGDSAQFDHEEYGLKLPQ